jgi:catechol 2,3-dioxygenase-like lactoylglutathione lyase family enzyme
MSAAVPSAVGAVTLFVEDPQRSKAFYEKVFDTAAVYEDEDAAAFRFENLIVNLLRTTAAHELVEPAPVAEQGSGSRFQLTIWVEDTNAACADLAARGVALLNGPIDRPWKVRTACFTDPDGHVWELAQQLS